MMTDDESSPRSRWAGAATDLITGLIVIGALGVVLSTVRMSTAGPRTPKALSEGAWQALLQGGRVIGSLDAPVAIVEFADFECPACAHLSNLLHEVLRKHDTKVRIVFHHYPLSFHAHSGQAARAAECAALQGRFEAYHDSLFAKYRVLEVLNWSELAQASGIPDTADFRSCLTRIATQRQIEQDILLGNRVPVRETPTVFVNGKPYRGGGVQELEALIQQAEHPRWWRAWRR
jgi:protein-disulfide isomerase